MKTLINWFEIPVADMARACAFYEAVFDMKLRHESMCRDVLLAVFPYEMPATGGALCKSDLIKPGKGGCIPYLDGGADLAAPLARAEKLGAKVVLGKTLIAPEIGYMALFEDCEGNVIGLHSVG
ncbi:MAG TPA: VOC family protein [Rhodocyclaceae bacterium]|nr:VOC family protein [Rhodocyclaceae bacterium]